MALILSVRRRRRRVLGLQIGSFLANLGGARTRRLTLDLACGSYQPASISTGCVELLPHVEEAKVLVDAITQHVPRLASINDRHPLSPQYFLVAPFVLPTATPHQSPLLCSANDHDNYNQSHRHQYESKSDWWVELGEHGGFLLFGHQHGRRPKQLREGTTG